VDKDAPSSHAIKSRFSDAVEGFVARTGLALSWLYLLLAAIIVLQVTLRRGFGGGYIVLEEIQWHLYAVAIMFGISYRWIDKGHVGVDVFSRNFSVKKKATIDLLGNIFLLLPFTVIVMDHGIDFAYEAYRISERSDSPLGLPYRWVVKSVIPVSMALLLMTCLARSWRDVLILRQNSET